MQLWAGAQDWDYRSIRKVRWEYLSFIADTFTEIPKVPVTGYFGEETRDAVIAFQNRFGLNPDGIVGAVTWDAIASEYSNLRYGFVRRPGQFPGSNLGEE
ncbi:MAG: peptidoglycan-binding domain-containing protein [Oscillospiraceae bacterium]